MIIDFHEDVQTDLGEAIRYYGGISARLVAEFESEIQSVLRTIRRNPRHYHCTRDGLLRRANLRHFPYRILFKVNEEETRVVVLVICHSKRHPSFGLDRT
jgi:plasmid stabilization system protein ParE